MRWSKVYYIYNRNKRKQVKVLYILLMVSIFISTVISLAIPQIKRTTTSYIEENAALINGGDIKILAPYSSHSFNVAMKGIINEGASVNSINFYSTTVDYDKNQLFCMLAFSKSYNLSENEIILSSKLATETNKKKNDEINILGKTYTISSIEPSAYGVDETSEMFGYCKVSVLPDENMISSSKLYLLNIDDIKEIDSIKENLIAAEDGYTYTTVSDQKNNLLGELSTNLSMLNMLNTMCIIMTVISVLTSIFILIAQRKNDIAIMKCLAVPSKAIKKALQFELIMIVIIPILIGAIISRLFAEIILHRTGMAVDKDVSDIISGIIFYIVTYIGFIKISSTSVSSIKPLSVLRNDTTTNISNKIFVFVISLIYIMLILFIYAVFYVGDQKMFASSVAIMFIILVFFLAISLLIRIFTKFNYRNKLLIYTSCSIHSNLTAFCLTIISISMLSWFILFGFTFERTCKDSFNSSVQQKIEYNYMLSGSDETTICNQLNNNKYVGGYTVLNRELGTLINSKEGYRSIVIGNVNMQKYDIRFNIIDGNDLEGCNSNEVLISQKFLDEINMHLNDTIQIYMDDGNTKSLIIKGVYEAGGINDNLIIHKSNESFSVSPIFLISAKSNDFINEMENASVVNIDVMGMAIMNKVDDFLQLFKYLCFICIFSSMLFNINIIYIRLLNNKEIIIIQALGNTKQFLYQCAALKLMISFVLSSILSFAIYYEILKVIIVTMFDITTNITWSTFSAPIISMMAILCIYYTIERMLIGKYKDYSLLRDKV